MTSPMASEWVSEKISNFKNKNISLNNTEHFLSAKCSERLTNMLSLVHSCCVLFSEVWSRLNFSLNKS